MTKLLDMMITVFVVTGWSRWCVFFRPTVGFVTLLINFQLAGVEVRKHN